MTEQDTRDVRRLKLENENLRKKLEELQKRDFKENIKTEKIKKK
jgi:regulator of replication initiation timing